MKKESRLPNRGRLSRKELPPSEKNIRAARDNLKNVSNRLFGPQAPEPTDKYLEKVAKALDRILPPLS